MAEQITVLGSTGSIGTQTLDVVRNRKSIQILAMSAYENMELLSKQIIEFKPKIVCVKDEQKAEELKKKLTGFSIPAIITGIDGLIEISTLKEIDTVVTAVSGNVGIRPTYEAVKEGKNIALANKETLVSAGELLMKEVQKYNVHLYPVDSEHSAIFQCLQGNEGNKISRIILTASGGPFRGKTFEELRKVTAKDALKHPNWNMGRKITIDSATLMNKGLEVMEAKWLFQVEIDQIEVVVHPQSIIHSAVEYEDGAIIAQLGEPDMRVPIQYALTYPKRFPSPAKKMDFAFRNNLTFEKPDMDTFRCLKLAYRAIKEGGTIPVVLNAANEIAVHRFLKGEIGFLDIPAIIESAMNAHKAKQNYTIEDLTAADQWARSFAQNEKTVH